MGIFARWRGRASAAEPAERNLDAILEASLRQPVVGEIYPDDAADHRKQTEDLRERVLVNAHFFNDAWFRINTPTPGQSETICDFLLELSQLVSNRGIILTAETIEHLADMISSGDTQIAYWQEPWMIPFKITRRRAVDLFETCLVRTRGSVPFEKLSECGIKARWAKNYDELSDRLRADSMDGSSLMKAFRTALKRVARIEDRADIRSICHTLDYALACMGDRHAMMSVSETIRRICVPMSDENDEGFAMTEARRDELCLVSDSWRRLSSVVKGRPMGDGERELAEMLAPERIDLRTLDVFFEDRPGWVLPPPNIVPLPSAAWRIGDWRAALFAPSDGQQDTAVLGIMRQVFDKRREAKLLDLFKDSDAAMALKNSAEKDARSETLQDELGTIVRMVNIVMERCPYLPGIEKAIICFAQIRAESNAVVDTYSRNLVSRAAFTTKDGLEAFDAEPEKVDEPVLTKSAAKPSFPMMEVLDRIGESEESSRTPASETFGRLLQPFELKSSARTADEVFTALSAEFPWMREANEYAARAVAFSGRTSTGAMKMEPVLLHGLPGIGKTRWVRRIAEITGVPTYVSGMAGVDTTKSIIGSERGWVNARPSLPAYAFMGTEVANPFIYVDEVDKSTRWESIADAFLPMLEDETARRYSDIYLLGNLNLTAANFVFSANDLSKLSAEFMSRVRIVNIRTPSLGEITPVVRTMVVETCQQALLKQEDVDTISEDLVSRSREIFVKTTNLREVKKFIREEVERTIWSPPGPRLVK